jgi:major outer membrane protein
MALRSNRLVLLFPVLVVLPDVEKEKGKRRNKKAKRSSIPHPIALRFQEGAASMLPRVLSKKKWLSLGAAALCGMASSARADDPVFMPVPTNAPLVQLVDNHEQPDNCRSGIMGGGSVYILRPYINNNTAFVTTTGIGTATPVQSEEDFNWNFHVAPAAWLGWSSQCGFGFRARYFQFDNDSEDVSGSLTAVEARTTTITPPTGLSPLVGVPPRGLQSPGVFLSGGLGQDQLTAGSDLEIRTVDGEATYAHECCHFGLLVSIGGRYLHMHQNYHAALVNIPFPGFSEISSLNANHNFEGGGPTSSLTARWQIGHSGLAVFGTARGSLLIGTSRQTAVFTENIADPVNGNQLNQASNQANDNVVIPVGELEGGLEYSRPLGRTRLFVRGAAVNQTYFDAGSSSSKDGNLSLFGAQVSVGFNY